jgi:hypothetical protein
MAEAEEVLASAHELAARLGPDEHEDLAAEWLTRVRLARGAAPPAGSVDLAHVARQDFFLHLFEPPAYHRLCWQLDAGDALGVERELRRRGIESNVRMPEPARESEYLLLARALVARGRGAEALPLPGRHLLAAPAGGRRGTAIAALALQAVARHLQGSAPQAQEALRRALELARDEGYVRVFVIPARPCSIFCTAPKAPYLARPPSSGLRRCARCGGRRLRRSAFPSASASSTCCAV